MYLDVAQVFPEIAQDLERVEERLLREVKSDLSFVTEVASHLIVAGGKRIRPSLTLACAGIASLPVPEDSIAGAVSVELVHLGSLHHDDVMDGASTRRGVASVNERWDVTTAVLSGDFLLARASVLAAQVGTEFSELLAATIAELCEGQILEHQDAHNCDRTIASYETSISGKTASLLSTSCRIGAITAGLSRDEIEAVTEFGRSYGMAFQILDDINDLTSDRQAMGKPSGQDLMEGNYTLPVLLTLGAGGRDDGADGGEADGADGETDGMDGGGTDGAEAGEALRKLLESGLDETKLEQALELVRSGDGIDRARDVARSWADKASSALEVIRDNPHSQKLRSVTSQLAKSTLGG